ncbi:DUF885 domain-containing protein [Olivibacter sp. XZL3]|uniref:DUF885 domain-containing protein n=1 Tax=Olivibacter sp. XZL3 TaxID=1735116 RepID=UPI0010663491|nr:DUF885 domain-containing protein [Olivibacter sp. XZL3]
MKYTIFKKYFPYLLTACVACSSGQSKRPSNEEDKAFSAYTDHFVTALWKQYPSWATRAGYHAYDTVLTLPTPENAVKNKSFLQAQLDSLSAYPLDRLSASQQIDYHLIENRLKSMIWSEDTLKSFEWDPSSYNEAGTFAQILTGRYAPLKERLRAFGKRLQGIPAYYEAAKKQIKDPVPELQALAIKQLKGGIPILSTNFADSIEKADLSAEERKAMLMASENAVKAINNFTDWLSGLRSTHPKSFRLGRDLYEQKFAYQVQANQSAEGLYHSAIQRKNYVHGEMMKLSKELWPKYFGNIPMPTDTLVLIKKVVDTLSVNHASAAGFLDTVRNQIPRLIDFINQKDLLYIDPSKPLTVRETPAYMGGVAVASVSAPGPYDKGGMTYFNVIPLAGWSAAKTESFLREYNHYILQTLCIHEAIPGHYTQLVYANQSPSLIKSLFGNGAMIEGWAVYTEQMMLENGYGGNTPEMWLMWYKWHLRAVANAILDYEVHVNGMSRAQALDFLINGAFQEQAEAEGKWDRVTLSSVQLTNYFSGYHEIYQLREDLKKKDKDAFNLKKFHEQFLSYGNAPVKYIRELMLN